MFIILLCITLGFLLLLLGLEAYMHFFPEEDVYTDEAIQKAKKKGYPPLSRLSLNLILEYKINEKVAIFGYNTFKELYEHHPECIRPIEKWHLASLGKIVLTEEDCLEYNAVRNGNVVSNYNYDYDDKETTATEKILEMSLDERMEILGVGDYTEMCKYYPEYVTHSEFKELLQQGQIRSADDVIYFNGRYYENEYSEDWEDLEYEYDKDHR